MTMNVVFSLVLFAAASAGAAVTAQLADPLEWLYPDSVVGAVRECASMIVRQAEVHDNGASLAVERART